MNLQDAIKIAGTKEFKNLQKQLPAKQPKKITKSYCKKVQSVQDAITTLINQN